MNKEQWKRISYDLPSAGKPPFFMDLDLNRFSQRMIYEEAQELGVYEKDISYLMQALLKSGDTVIDIGAHIGYFTLLAAAMVEKSGKVFSFEPIQENRNHLLQHIGMNGFTNIETFPHVVGNQSSTTTFFYNRDNDGGHALWDVGKHPFNEKTRKAPCPITLPITCLDDFFSSQQIPKLTMMKIDTEGNELCVLQGARQLIKGCRMKCIACELNRFGLKQMGHSEKELRCFMYDLEYETLAYVDDHLKLLAPNQYLKANNIMNLFFMPKEFIKGSTKS